MRKGPLGITERFYVESNYKTMSVDDMAKIMDRAKGLVKALVNRLIMEEEKAKEEEEEEYIEDENALTVMNNMNIRNGAAIMTQAAGELADEIAKSARGSKKRPSCITSIKRKKKG